MKILLFLFTFGAGPFIFAQNNPKPCRCCDEKYRQFDFWVGDWDVKDAEGNLLGHNNISFIEDSCGLKEQWTGSRGVTGTSVSFYNKNKDEWHQSWIDANGSSIIMNGKLIDGAIVMLSEQQQNNTESGYFQNRTTWRPLDDGSVKHTWEQTRDGGHTWQVVFEGYYYHRNH